MLPTIAPLAGCGKRPLDLIETGEDACPTTENHEIASPVGQASRPVWAFFRILLVALALPCGGFAFPRSGPSIGIALQARGAGRRPAMRSTNPLGRAPEVISEGRL